MDYTVGCRCRSVLVQPPATLLVYQHINDDVAGRLQLLLGGRRHRRSFGVDFRRRIDLDDVIVGRRDVHRPLVRRQPDGEVGA